MDLQEALKVVAANFPSKSVGQSGEDFMEEVDKYMRENKCSRFVAMQEVHRRNPHLRRKYLEKFNPHIKFFD
jgi:hypothetical protein